VYVYKNTTEKDVDRVCVHITTMWTVRNARGGVDIHLCCTRLPCFSSRLSGMFGVTANGVPPSQLTRFERSQWQRGTPWMNPNARLFPGQYLPIATKPNVNKTALNHQSRDYYVI